MLWPLIWLSEAVLSCFFAPSVEEAQWLIGRPKLIETWDWYISEDLPGTSKHDGLDVKNFFIMKCYRNKDYIDKWEFQCL